MKALVLLIIISGLVWIMGSGLWQPTSSSSSVPSGEVTAVEVEGIFIAPGTASPVVVLTELGGEHRSLPIWIGLNEAQAIRRLLEGEPPPRPLTHELLAQTVRELGGVVTRVVVTDLDESTFYARIDLSARGDSISIDARPSDAIALALGVEAPVFVNMSVLDEAATRDLIVRSDAAGDLSAVDEVGCGIFCQPLDPELAGVLGVETGVIVADLSDEQTTDDGLERGDVILDVGGQAAADVETVTELLSGLTEEDPLPVSVMRGGDVLNLELTCK